MELKLNLSNDPLLRTYIQKLLLEELKGIVRKDFDKTLRKLVKDVANNGITAEEKLEKLMLKLVEAHFRTNGFRINIKDIAERTFEKYCMEYYKDHASLIEPALKEHVGEVEA